MSASLPFPKPMKHQEELDFGPTNHRSHHVDSVASSGSLTLPPTPSPFRCAPGPLLRIGPSRGCHRRSAHHTRAAGTFVRILASDTHDEIAPQGAKRTPASRLGRRKDEESPRWILLSSLGPLSVLHLRSESPRLRRHSPALVRIESD